MNKREKIRLAGLCLLLMSSPLRAQTWETYPDTWVAVDELGRNVAQSDEGVTRNNIDKNSTIGMFYYIWHGMHPMAGKDVTELLEENPDNPDWGAEQTFHWGSKPWLGYYTAGDKYVVAKHMQMLVDAGVDFLFLDATNGLHYPTRVEVLMREIDRREALGMKSPKLAFMVHSNAKATAENIYNTFYKDSKYDKYWFEYEGKPLLLGDKSEISYTLVAGLVDRFTFRNSWAWMNGAKADEWAWLEYYPQRPGWTSVYNSILGTTVKKTEQISVSVAQHATTKVGKSYHGGKQPAYDKYGLCKETPYGLYFQEQWNQAIDLHPPIVMVTQFNEWIAQRFVINNQGEYGNIRPGATAKIGETYFVDVYNAEFSRDLEPGTHPLIRDNYYLQLVSNTRKYRGVNKIPVPTVNLSIDIDGDFSQWDAESVEYRDDKGDVAYISKDVQTPETLERKSNDIVMAKVTKDAHNIYFYVETMDDISDFEASKYWMRLLLNTDTDYTTGWGGYDYMVYKDAATGKYSLMKNQENTFQWETITPVEVKIAGKQMHLAISKSALGLAGDHDIDFKWADNITDNNPDIMTFISDGDVAPNGRFNYRYKGASLPLAISRAEKDDADFTITCTGRNVAFSYNDSSDVSIQVFDIMGRMMKSIEEPGHKAEMVLNDGVYMTRYSLDGRLGMRKFVVK